jgi:sporulation protein YlmC with PRC-barrel domain
MALCLAVICGFNSLVNICALDQVDPGGVQVSSSSASEIRVIQNHLVSQLVGMTLENEDCQTLGRVKDFILDLNLGRPLYAIVSSGGLLGIGQRIVLVPAPALTMATAQKGMLAVNISQRRWKLAPEFRRRELAALNSPAEVRRIFQYYGQSDPAFVTQTGRELSDDQSQAHPASGHGSNNVCLASELLGDKLANRQGERLGKICDVLLDLPGRKPALAVFKGCGMLAGTGRYAAPLALLEVTDANHLALDVDVSNFHQAAPLNEQSWREASDGRNEPVFRFQELRHNQPSAALPVGQAQSNQARIVAETSTRRAGLRLIGTPS